MVINEFVRAITCTFMHCYAPIFEDVEVANWFGPVRLHVHLPPLPPPPPLPLQKYVFFLDFDSLLKKSSLTTYTSRPSPPTARPPKPKTKKSWSFFYLDLDSL